MCPILGTSAEKLILFSQNMLYLCTCHGYVGTCEQVGLFVTDIQSWWEVPSIAHFCSLFRAAFNLLDFDIEVR
jgi:hypothetical protein